MHFLDPEKKSINLFFPMLYLVVMSHLIRASGFCDGRWSKEEEETLIKPADSFFPLKGLTGQGSLTLGPGGHCRGCLFIEALRP